MKTKISTDRDQSRRLVACGVGPDTADMAWRTIKEPYGDDMAWHTPKLLTLPYGEAETIYGKEETEPSWSLSRLLALFDPELCLSLTKHREDGKLLYTVDSPFFFEIDKTQASTPIEACVLMIEWLVGNGYKLNKIEQ